MTSIDESILRSETEHNSLAMCVPLWVLSTTSDSTTKCTKSAGKRFRVTDSSTRSRKRVRFEPSKTEASQVKEQVLDHVPSCSELSAEEKAERWIQPAEWVEIRRAASEEALECRREDHERLLRGESHLAFSAMYAKVYEVCHLESTDGTKDVVQLISTELLMLMARSQSRGLEDRKVPQIALQRRFSRKQVIHLVLQIQIALGNEPERLREASEALSNPSRKFAEVLGVTDATAAMLEYTASLGYASKENPRRGQNTQETDESAPVPLLHIAVPFLL